MNIIMLLLLAVTLCAIAFLVTFFRGREECHNSEDPPEKLKGKKAADAPATDLPPAPETVAAEKELAAMTPAEAPKGISEAEISEKTQAGLTRDQAIEILTSQRAHDKALKGKG